MPKSTETFVIGKQIIRSATSTAANYRACCRARSKAEFIAKLGIAVEEADETLFWLEMIEDLDVISHHLIKPLKEEGETITRILAASRRTAKQNLRA